MLLPEKPESYHALKEVMRQSKSANRLGKDGGCEPIPENTTSSTGTFITLKRSSSTANYRSARDIFQRLYLEKDKKRMQKLENEVKRQAMEMQECTFHPTTNLSRDVSPSLGRKSAGSGNANVFERLASSQSH